MQIIFLTVSNWKKENTEKYVGLQHTHETKALLSLAPTSALIKNQDTAQQKTHLCFLFF